MTLLERLQSHKGGLIRIETQLCWYGGRGGWDGLPGRICLLLDATAAGNGGWTLAGAFTAHAGPVGAVAALLLVDGAPHWVWVVAKDIELLDGVPQ